MTIQLRRYQPLDREFILSLVKRFSDFELPEWRQKDDIDHTNQVSLEQTLKQPEPDSAVFVAEEESGALAGFIHLQTQTDYFSGERHGYISDLAVSKDFEGQGIGRMLLETAEEWRVQMAIVCLRYMFLQGIRALNRSTRNRVSVKKSLNMER